VTQGEETVALQIIFGMSLDAGAWLGSQRHLDAAVVGPLGLVRLLEGQLGLGGVAADPAARVASLVHHLAAVDTFYARSAANDPWGTARALLSLHDLLWEHGWRGEGLGCTRLADLAEVTAGIPMGLHGRVERLLGWLDSRTIAIAGVALVDDEEDLSPIWRRLFQRLRTAGVKVQAAPTGPFGSADDGNLARSRVPGFSPQRGDRSLQLVRPSGPRAAARSVAAAWRSDGWDRPLIVGGDEVLDEALAEAGLPSIGKTRRSNILLEVLPLILDLAIGPVDVERVDELLRLESSPIPFNARGPLRQALQAQPSLAGDLWRSTYEALCGDVVTRAALDTVFVAVADEGRAARKDLLEGRIVLVEQWAATLEQKNVPAACGVVLQVDHFRRQVEQSAVRRLSRDVLRALSHAAGEHAEHSARPPTAGVVSVMHPDGVLADAPRVVWWNCVASAAARPRLPLLRPEERMALARIGVELPSPAAMARANARRSRRPWTWATEQLLLISPMRDAAGEQQTPHPLWDEMTSHLVDRTDARLLETRHVLRAVARKLRVLQPRAVLEAQRVVDVPTLRASPLRRTESPTSMGALLGCSFRYVASYGARLRNRVLSSWDVDARALGLSAHAMLSMAIGEGVLGAINTAAAAAAFFDARVGGVSGLLLRPEAQPERLHLRAAFIGAMDLLASVCRANGLRVHESEVTLQGTVDGIEVQGTPDLVLVDVDNAAVVIDFKWGGETFRREELRDGISHQLATYTALAQAQGQVIRAAGYLILGSQQLLLAGDGLQGAQHIDGPPLEGTWKAGSLAVAKARALLDQGQVVVAGMSTDEEAPPVRTSLRGGVLVTAPPCEFCELSGLCGRRALQVPK
jgi:hypothetical protein